VAVEEPINSSAVDWEQDSQRSDVAGNGRLTTCGGRGAN
jgi:hypothetical protein